MRFYSENDNNGKSLYRKLLQNLDNRSISEESFIKELCDIITKNMDFSDFEKDLKERLS